MLIKILPFKTVSIFITILALTLGVAWATTNPNVSHSSILQLTQLPTDSSEKDALADDDDDDDDDNGDYDDDDDDDNGDYDDDDDDDDDDGDSGPRSFSNNFVIEEGDGGYLQLVSDIDADIAIEVDAGALDDYMDDKDVDAVNITVQLTEQYAPCGSGSHYHLDFTFGPSGAFFKTPLKVKLKKKYINTGCHAWMYGEDGEELEADRDDFTSEVAFKVPHFSNYYYDGYQY